MSSHSHSTESAYIIVLYSDGDVTILRHDPDKERFTVRTGNVRVVKVWTVRAVDEIGAMGEVIKALHSAVLTLIDEYRQSV